MALCNVETLRVAFAHIMPASWLHAPATHEMYLAKWTEFLAPRDEPNAAHFLAERGDQVIGVCHAGPLRVYVGLETMERATTLELWTLYVLPEAQGTGLARTLFFEVVRKAFEMFPNCGEKLVVLTFEDNAQARRFYEKLGGRLWGILPTYEIGGGNYRVATYEWDGVTEWLKKWEEEGKKRKE